MRIAVGGAMACRMQRLAQAAYDKAAHPRRGAKPHLGFGRVHIHIHLMRRHKKMEQHRGMASRHQIIMVGGAQRAIKPLPALAH